MTSPVMMNEELVGNLGKLTKHLIAVDEGEAATLVQSAATLIEQLSNRVERLEAFRDAWGRGRPDRELREMWDAEEDAALTGEHNG